MIRRHPLLFLFVLGLLAALAWAWQNRIHLAAFPAIIGAYTAKEYCSCRYVMGTPRTIAGPIPNSTCRSAASSTTKPAAG